MNFVTAAFENLTDEQRTFVEQSFAAGKAEGAFPAHRAAPGDGETIILSFIGNDYVGFTSFYIPDQAEIVWLDLVYVEPQFRRRSVATFLVSKVMAFAQCENLPLELGTLQTNTAMQALAASLGLDGRSILYRKEPVTEYVSTPLGREARR